MRRCKFFFLTLFSTYLKRFPFLSFCWLIAKKGIKKATKWTTMRSIDGGWCYFCKLIVCYAFLSRTCWHYFLLNVSLNSILLFRFYFTEILFMLQGLFFWFLYNLGGERNISVYLLSISSQQFLVGSCHCLFSAQKIRNNIISYVFICVYFQI